MLFFLYALCFLLIIYCIRHYIFAINRLFNPPYNPYAEIIYTSWPSVTIFVAAHNEEAVIKDILNALANIDYSPELLQIIIINDRSTDNTRIIIDNFIKNQPKHFTAFHRKYGLPGKAAALKDVLCLAKHEILIFFDADYIPSKGLIKQLVVPFLDPEIGAVMGRVIPENSSKNLLTRLLDIERSSGYQVNQQARMNLNLIPQFGGTVGGIRKQALEEVGGWQTNFLAEDTEITYRLFCNNWKTAYVNQAECHEEVPETWQVRKKQIMRWTKGHNQALIHYITKFFYLKNMHWYERLDGILLLGIFIMPSLLIAGWLITLTAYYLGWDLFYNSLFIFLTIIGCCTFGNFTTFYEAAIALYLDKNVTSNKRNCIRLIPLQYFNFFINTLIIFYGLIEQILHAITKQNFHWHKTVRFRDNNSDIKEH